MMNLRKASLLGALLLFGAAGCADLEVRNPNDPDRGQALVTASDVENLIAGSFNSWFSATHTYYLLPLSTMSFQHSVMWNNFGMVPFSRIPREPLVNATSYNEYTAFSVPWSRAYQAIAAVNDGLRVLNDPATGVAEELGADSTARAQAWGRFVQGLSYATLAALYDRAFVVDETTSLDQEVEASSYEAVMAAASGYFDEAISISEANSFVIPADWATVEVSSDELARIAYSMRAAFRASIPRTPEERSMVDWNAVLSDIANGVDEDWVMYQDGYAGWYNSLLDYGSFDYWQMLPYMMFGMADTSDNWQQWLNTPLESRHPVLDGENILFITPDERFPQGTTLAEQTANPGTKVQIHPSSGSAWGQPSRGTWRFSWYRNYEYNDYNDYADWNVPQVEMEEMDLLAAEAHYWLGQYDEAAALINKTRVAAGLSPATPGATNDGNTSCVPRLPSGECGDLLEMLKWEKRMEVWMTGVVLGNASFFDSRRWGDLWEGTPLHYPIPAGDLQTLQMPLYTFGGAGGDGAADVSTYNWESFP